MKVAVVGVTGLVGRKMLEILAERNFPVSELIPSASERSIGQAITFQGKEWKIIPVEQAVESKADLALFSAGGTVSLEWAPRFAEANTIVIDNSSAWRMHPDVKLIVPEINGHLLTPEDRIIANPNCSTIQMVMVLNPLHKKYRLKRVVVSTYQSVSGTGQKAVAQLENERKGANGVRAYPHPIDRNCIPQCDIFMENGYTREEMKMVNETRKIMGDESIQVSPTAVRVPVTGGHSESVNITFENEYDIENVRRLLSETPGIVVQDDPAISLYPMPLTAHNRDEVFVGRIRRDPSAANSLNLWIVSDNLRKGAATNAVQIAEVVLKVRAGGTRV